MCIIIVKQKWFGKMTHQSIKRIAPNDGLCAEGAVYRQDDGLVLQSSTDAALTEWAPEACFRKTNQSKPHQVRGTRTSRHLGV